MLTVILPSPPNITYGIQNMIHMLHHYKDNLLDMLKITRYKENGVESFIFVALFREPGSIGHFTAVINQFGTNFGRGAGGTGSYGYAAIMSFLDDHEINCSTLEWDEIDEHIRMKLENPESTTELYQVWTDFLVEKRFDVLFTMLPSMEYQLNSYWKNQRENM